MVWPRSSPHSSYMSISSVSGYSSQPRGSMSASTLAKYAPARRHKALECLWPRHVYIDHLCTVNVFTQATNENIWHTHNVACGFESPWYHSRWEFQPVTHNKSDPFDLDTFITTQAQRTDKILRARPRYDICIHDRTTTQPSSMFDV